MNRRIYFRSHGFSASTLWSSGLISNGLNVSVMIEADRPAVRGSNGVPRIEALWVCLDGW